MVCTIYTIIRCIHTCMHIARMCCTIHCYGQWSHTPQYFFPVLLFLFKYFMCVTHTYIHTYRARHQLLTESTYTIVQCTFANVLFSLDVLLHASLYHEHANISESLQYLYTIQYYTRFHSSSNTFFLLFLTLYNTRTFLENKF